MAVALLAPIFPALNFQLLAQLGMPFAPEGNPFVLAITDGLLLRREPPAHGASGVTGRGLVEVNLGQKFP